MTDESTGRGWDFSVRETNAIRNLLEAYADQPRLQLSLFYRRSPSFMKIIVRQDDATLVTLEIPFPETK